jgi:hypothetical protein
VERAARRAGRSLDPRLRKAGDWSPTKSTGRQGQCLSWRTVERTKASISAKAKREGYGQGGAWKWELANELDRPLNPPLERQQNCVPDNAEDGGLSQISDADYTELDI